MGTREPRFSHPLEGSPPPFSHFCGLIGLGPHLGAVVVLVAENHHHRDLIVHIAAGFWALTSVFGRTHRSVPLPREAVTAQAQSRAERPAPIRLWEVYQRRCGWAGRVSKVVTDNRKLLGVEIPDDDEGRGGTSAGCGRMLFVLPDGLAHGLELFNRADFFEAHEALEDIWRAAPGPEKKFLQGLIQVAVALYHHGNGNMIGARSVLKRGFRNLSRYPEGFAGIHLAGLLNSISDWQRALDEGTAVPALPKIERQSSVVSAQSSAEPR